MRNVFAALLLLASQWALAQLPASNPFGNPASPQFLPVEEAYQLAVEPLPEQGLRLYWQIADSYYLYQHAFKFQLSDSDGELTPTVVFPPAIERTDEYFGEVSVYYHYADLNLDLPRPTSGEMQLAVTSQGCADAGLCYPPRTQHFRIASDGAVSEIAAPARPAAQPPAQAGAALATLPYMLLLAFLGGAILNLMPCVFPVLSLKVLSFTQGSDRDHHRHAWSYTAGVIISFVLVAALLIALQQAGRAIGWGFQLQSPGFVIALCYLFLAMGLSLSGVVELGGSLMNAGSGLAARSGLAGSFFTGVLAVVVASPCTAPFMGTALGFAVTQPAAVGLSVFAALGAGMAAPLVLFSYSGAARRLMPRPGAWMLTLRQLLAFPLYGAAIWLLWVVGRQTGVNTMAAVLAGGLALGLALWLWQLGGWRRGLAVACAALALGLAGTGDLDSGSGGSGKIAAAEGREPFSETRLAALRAAGTPVFVDVTADWCITCIANERAVLLTDPMREEFARRGVAYLVADWTNYDPEIGRFVASHGRSGIPLYLMYPANPALPPQILPQILTDETVREALAVAAGN